MCRFHAPDYHYQAPVQAPISSPISDRAMRSLIVSATIANAIVAGLWVLYL